MSEQQQSNRKALIYMSILGLIVMASIAYVFTRPPKTSMITDLYQYYPQNTVFYLEIAPDEKLLSRFFQGLDKLRAISSEVKRDEVNLETIVKKDFQPALSLGAWKPESATGDSATAKPQEPPFLAVILTKSGFTLESLATDLKIPANEYTIAKEGDVTYLESKASPNHPFLASHKSYLLIANSKQTIQQALKEYQAPGTLLDNPTYKKHLALLPKDRQGTVLALTSELQNMPQQEKMAQQDETFRKLAEIQKQVQAATPVMLGSIAIDKNQFITFDSFTPVDLANVKDEAFRKDIKTLLEKQATFNLTQFLPKETVAFGGMVGLGNYFDMYMNYVTDEAGKKSIEGIQNQLKMVGLDLRKNIVSLLDGKSAVGVVAKKGQPDVLLFLNHNAETHKTMEQFGMMAAQMSGGKISDKKIDETHVVKVLESPAVPMKIGYSHVGSDTLVLGTQAGLENLYEVQQSKAASIAENKLYKELAASMPEKASGVFFVDFRQGTALIDDLTKNQPESKQEKSLKTLLGGIEGAAGSNMIDKDMMIRGRLTVKLAAEN